MSIQLLAALEELFDTTANDVTGADELLPSDDVIVTDYVLVTYQSPTMSNDLAGHSTSKTTLWAPS